MFGQIITPIQTKSQGQGKWRLSKFNAFILYNKFN
ncbi:hypothetical protein BABL1_gene_627 [Candidatus Babela massiliensis]|uniref:Uncharacterized protein n=1 Tax=Candidatus Babela massiliensis TaxID=673862 RepID=V6DHD3_9BACT|nr:hypothetical protein BABL1_gene_627 [Candidatus Babela massiliensis]